MDRLREAQLHHQQDVLVVSMEGEVALKATDIGWRFVKGQPQSYIPITFQEIKQQLNGSSELLVFIETEELRHMAKTWDKPINSYSTEDPMYYEALKLIDGKAVISFE